MNKTIYSTILFLLLTSSWAFSQVSDKYYSSKAEQFYDSEKNAFIKNQEVLIKNNLVIEVGYKLTIPPNTEVLDYGGGNVTV